MYSKAILAKWPACKAAPKKWISGYSQAFPETARLKWYFASPIFLIDSWVQKTLKCLPMGKPALPPTGELHLTINCRSSVQSKHGRIYAVALSDCSTTRSEKSMKRKLSAFLLLIIVISPRYRDKTGLFPLIILHWLYLTAKSFKNVPQKRRPEADNWALIKQRGRWQLVIKTVDRIHPSANRRHYIPYAFYTT